MGELLIVTGPPGAGKSTVARLLADRFDPSVLVEGDAFFAFRARGAIAPWLLEADQQNTTVTEAAAAATGRLALGAFTVIYDAVIGPWFLPTFMAHSGLDRVDYVVLLPTVEECVRRVHHRTGHGFDDEAATRHMHDQFASAAIEDRHLLAPPPDDLLDTVELILGASEAGRLEHLPSH